jgi:LAO/AO transport system kinase
LDAHAAWLGESGDLVLRRRARTRSELEALATAAYRASIDPAALDAAVDAVHSGAADPYTAAATLRP